MEANADVNATDNEGNTPVHIKCAGEVGKPLELHAIQVLHEYGAELDKRNVSGETCFQVAARCGHTEVLQLLFELDETGIRESIQTAEQKTTPPQPSTLALALRSDHLDTATW